MDTLKDKQSPRGPRRERHDALALQLEAPGRLAAESEEEDWMKHAWTCASGRTSVRALHRCSFGRHRDRRRCNDPRLDRKRRPLGRALGGAQRCRVPLPRKRTVRPRSFLADARSAESSTWRQFKDGFFPYQGADIKALVRGAAPAHVARCDAVATGATMRTRIIAKCLIADLEHFSRPSRSSNTKYPNGTATSASPTSTSPPAGG